MIEKKHKSLSVLNTQKKNVKKTYSAFVRDNSVLNVCDSWECDVVVAVCIDVLKLSIKFDCVLLATWTMRDGKALVDAHTHTFSHSRWRCPFSLQAPESNVTLRNCSERHTARQWMCVRFTMRIKANETKWNESNRIAVDISCLKRSRKCFISKN